MCGIVGVRRRSGGVRAGELKAMAGELVHRGPDAEGYWIEGSVGFGHRRLSIIDLAGSPQPMASNDGRQHVCFNGEILNYKELRAGLGYRFQTQGDTEVLLALYRAHGPDSVLQLAGQFAYALYDMDDQNLWLFRDRLGILPLYYYLDDELLLFASEIKAILKVLPHRPEPDGASLQAYLARRAVPAPATLFKGIRKLPPGHTLGLSPDWSVQIRPYWSIPEEAALRIDGDQAVERVDEALLRGVQRALVADVPVGAYLSGGVDSSLIVAMASKMRGGQGIDTFSAGFRDPRFDELPAARRLSGLLGTNHHEVVLDPEDFTQLWPRMTWHRDAPVSEPADIAVYRLATLARQQVKVVLSGEGSDELFAGYPKHRFARWAGLADLAPPPVRRAAFDGLQRLLPPAASRQRVAARALAVDPRHRNEAWFSPFTPAERAKLLGLAPPGRQGWRRPCVGGAPVARMLREDCRQWLPDNLLERGDRMSMAASLELRPPFLDRDVVDLAFALPVGLKVRANDGKWVVKQVALRYLPADVVHRRKIGFRVPLDVWFREGLQEMARSLLLDPGSFASRVLDTGEVRRLLDSHRLNRSNEDIRIWTLVSLEVWHRTFFRAGAGL